MVKRQNMMKLFILTFASLLVMANFSLISQATELSTGDSVLLEYPTQLPITVEGIVQKGQQKAREYEIPTANIPISLELAPGVYGGYTSVAGNHNLQNIPSLCYCTNNLLESYLIGYSDLELYNSTITAELLYFHRSPVAFESDEQMKRIIQEDLAQLNKVFNQAAKTTKTYHQDQQIIRIYPKEN